MCSQSEPHSFCAFRHHNVGIPCVKGVRPFSIPRCLESVFGFIRWWYLTHLVHTYEWLISSFKAIHQFFKVRGLFYIEMKAHTPSNNLAFRSKLRNDAVFAAEAAKDPGTYERHNHLGREVAEFLRKNVVQAVKVSEQGDETWSKLSLTYMPLSAHIVVQESGWQRTRSWATTNRLRILCQ